MAKNVRRRGKILSRRKKGNWFTRLKIWQRVLVCFAGVFICIIGSACLYVMAKWNKIDTQEINAEDLIINQEVQVQKNEEVDLGEGILMSPCLALIPEMETWEKETAQTVLLWPA